MESQLTDPEFIKKCRLEMVKDCVIFNMLHGGWAIDEKEVRSKLDNVEDEKRLMIIAVIAAYTDDIKSLIRRI
ncbi:hypothetical protein D4T97_005210 [Siminovitchia acidinfaciens]|uniref:Uncharacterized protein n=1 Tax=Siminovitchia acidinfaciens TaxID=2321395 RepID=A0A429Y432_9BACI|nr:hypothetical protein [Siminovitchia acidinfaciens]RST76183.1 hypothetical protein D4T97_005210 [Siminovitchia acidinfaciens]